MSRSIHTTHRDLAMVQRSKYADPEQRSKQIVRVREALNKKSATKEQVWKARHQVAVREALPFALEHIQIVVCDQSQYVHYPANVEDLHVIMRLLPPGTLDGLSKIVLCLGEDEYLEDRGDEPDPFVGRLGLEILPGVFLMAPQGRQFPETATIKIYAYVYDATNMPDQAMRELYLRLQMLAAFVHEVAHHKGTVSQGKRGRWHLIPGHASERYARKQEYRWMQQIIIPYLEQTYADDVRAFREWMAYHGGVSLPLATFADDSIAGDFTLFSAIEHLAEAVDKGESLKETRLGFAHDLRLARHYDAALQCIARVLSEHPGDVQALALQAITYERQERYEDAERVAKTALALDAACEDAGEVLADVYRARGDWRGVEAATSKLIEQSEKPPYWKRIDRVCARLELGDFAGAEMDMQALGQLPYKNIPRRLAVLTILLLLRQERYAAALAAALAFMKNKRRVSQIEVLAVRFEAAHRLGKPRKAGRLTPQDIAFLRRRGYGAWMDRLIAEFGAGKKQR
ncbi:MAG TPA: hypothetical protein VH540_10305 [Ktedonobacterales bacterium]